MNIRIFWVRAMKCMCAQTRPRFILSSEGVFGGMEFEPMLTPRGKIPSTGKCPQKRIEPATLWTVSPSTTNRAIPAPRWEYKPRSSLCTRVPAHQLKRSWHSCPRCMNPDNKNTASMYHSRRQNVTTSMVGLKKNSHICKNLTKNVESQLGTQKIFQHCSKQLIKWAMRWG